MTPAQELKAKLLEQFVGLTAKDISVKYESYSLGSSINVEVKTVIPLSDVDKIAMQSQKIHRCEYTGDYLEGCNRFVHVRYGKIEKLPPWLMFSFLAAMKHMPEVNVYKFEELHRWRKDLASEMYKNCTSLNGFTTEEILGILRVAEELKAFVRKGLI
jgi:hypothetical protein